MELFGHELTNLLLDDPESLDTLRAATDLLKMWHLVLKLRAVLRNKVSATLRHAANW